MSYEGRVAKGRPPLASHPGGSQRALYSLFQRPRQGGRIPPGNPTGSVQLSTETRRTKWSILSLAWIVLAVLALLDTLAVRDYVALLDGTAAVSADGLPLQRSVPSDYADAQTWVRHALALQEGGGWQLRHTDIDNAPAGREVHWNSAFAHAISVAGRIESAVTGQPLPRATELALAWFNLPLLMLAVIGFSAWVASRAGAAAGVLIAFGMVGHNWFYLGFAPNYVDHHGLLSAATLGLVLGALFMGAGWWMPVTDAPGLLPSSRPAARRAALASAWCGGLGMWISAASVIPTIALVGAGGLAAGWFAHPRATESGAELDPDLWRLWSRIGAAVSFAAYLLEYAPSHMGLRLEANHPLYALAWLGGGELVAMLLEYRVARRRAPAWRVAAAIACVMVAPLTVALMGSRVFVPLDPRVSEVHAGIAEFLSLPAFLRAFGAAASWRFAVALALLLPVAAIVRARRADRIAILLTSVVTLGAAVLAVWQTRWWLTAGGAELCLLLAACAVVARDWSARSRWALVLLIAGVFAEQRVAGIIDKRADVRGQAMTPADAMEPLYRDVAATIRASQPTGDVVLLTNPNASTGIGYFGRFRTLGTLYWENADGLAAAASIFSARTDAEARALMRTHGVTHVAMVSRDNFLRTYLDYARPGSAPDAISETFGYRLLMEGNPSPWLRAIPFRVRSVAPTVVLLLQVVPDQPPLDANWNMALAQAAMGDAAATGRAERLFGRAIGRVPDRERRAALYDSAAAGAYQNDAHALALRLYSAAMALGPSPTREVNAAWILATSANDRVRNGGAALAIVEPIAAAHPKDPSVLEVYAAALAEVGRFDDAVTVTERVIAIARQNGDREADDRSVRRIESYRARRAWRR
jgi:hypothetical protein